MNPSITYFYSYEPASFSYSVDGEVSKVFHSDITTPKEPEVELKPLQRAKKRTADRDYEAEGEGQNAADEQGEDGVSPKATMRRERPEEFVCNDEKLQEESSYEVFLDTTYSYDSSTMSISCDTPFYAEWKRNQVHS